MIIRILLMLDCVMGMLCCGTGTVKTEELCLQSYAIINEFTRFVQQKCVKNNSDVWESVWREKCPEKLSWESFGRNGGEEEKPFLSDAGPASVHHLWQMCKFGALKTARI